MISVSVAMATFNGARFLREQFLSIAAQDQLPQELVICDDGSTDNTLDLAEEFKRRAPFDVMIVRNEQRLGYVENFFATMRRCRCDVIALCDQDDVWLPERLRRCLKPFEADREVLLVVHAGRVVDSLLRPKGWDRPRILRYEESQPGALPPFTGFPGFSLHVSARLINEADDGWRKALQSPVTGQAIEHDNWLCCVANALGRVVLLPDQLTLYRQHSGNASMGTSNPLKPLEMLGRPVGDATSFRRVARAASERVAYFDHLDEFVGDKFGALAHMGLARSRDSHRRTTRLFEKRALLYEHPGGGVQQMGVIARHVSDGDYGSRDRGGLGLESLACDLYVLSNLREWWVNRT